MMAGDFFLLVIAFAMAIGSGFMIVKRLADLDGPGLWIVPFLVGCLFTFLLAVPAKSHEAPAGWAYPLSCCSGYDCRPVSATWIEERGGAFIIPTTGERVPYTDKRIKASPDGEYHWCSKYGKDDTPTICLFVPPRSF